MVSEVDISRVTEHSLLWSHWRISTLRKGPSCFTLSAIINNIVILTRYHLIADYKEPKLGFANFKFPSHQAWWSALPCTRCRSWGNRVLLQAASDQISKFQNQPAVTVPIEMKTQHQNIVQVLQNLLRNDNIWNLFGKKIASVGLHSAHICAALTLVVTLEQLFLTR